MNRKNIVGYLEKIQKNTKEYSEKKFLSSIITCFSVCPSNDEIIDASRKEMERRRKLPNFWEDDNIVGNYYKFCFDMARFIYENLDKE